MTGLVAEVAAELGSDEALQADWRRLAEAQGNAFITPEWYRAWARHYGDDATTAIVAVRDAGGTLRGVLPLAVSGGGRTRRWGFGGANLGDLFSPACAPGDETEVARAAADALADAAVVVLDNVEADAAWVSALAGPSGGRGLAVSAYRDNSLPRIDLEAGGWDEYMAGRSRNLRSQIRRKTRALERDHGLGLRLADAATLDADLETFFRLHEARWENRGGSGSLNERTRAFHGDFAAAALERGWLRLWTLELEEEPAASWYGWSIGGAYCYYLAGFDPRFGDLSVGFVLLAHTIRAAADEGCATYELLLGEESYKARFATAERPVQTAVLVKRGHPMRALLGAEVGLWRLGRRLSPEARDRARGVYRAATGWLPTARRR